MRISLLLKGKIIYFLLNVSVFYRCLCVDLTMLKKEKKSDTHLGNISADLLITKDSSFKDSDIINFNLLYKDASGAFPLFRISKESGKLYTAQNLHAESLCIFKKECFSLVDAAVRKAITIIKLLEIKVIIKDVNDYHPEFPDEKVNIKFSESDGKGIKISIPNAVDKDVGRLNSQTRSS